MQNILIRIRKAAARAAVLGTSTALGVGILPAVAAAATDVGFADDTPGVFIYTAWVDSSYDPATGISTPDVGPNPGGTNCTGFVFGAMDAVITGAINDSNLEFLGDEPSEVASLTPGDDGELSSFSVVDTTPTEVNVALAVIDDFAYIGGTSDDEANVSLGTGGALGLTTGSSVIVADGVASTGTMTDDVGGENLDGAEILIFEDSEHSGMSIELRGDGQSVTIDLADYQVNPDAWSAADDITIAIDLDTVPFAGRWVDEIIITDDDIPTSPPGRSDCDPDQAPNSLDSSVEIDAVAVQTSQLIERNYATTVLLVSNSVLAGAVPDLALATPNSPASTGPSQALGAGAILVVLAGAATVAARRRT